MASRDYLIRQVEEMGIFLALLLRRILKMKEENQQNQMESAVKELLFQELKIDIEQVVVLQDADFLAVAKEHFTSEDQLEKFADVLMVLGKEIVSTFSLTKANYLLKALMLFNYLQNTSISFSYERRNKILEIEELAREKGLIY
jgi:glycyl-tRNA synthetase alpha subunit